MTLPKLTLDKKRRRAVTYAEVKGRVDKLCEQAADNGYATCLSVGFVYLTDEQRRVLAEAQRLRLRIWMEGWASI